MMRAGVALVAALALASALAPLLAPYDPTQPVAPPLSPPSWGHPLGTDGLGRDVLSRALYGGQTVLGVSLLATALSALVGFPLGMFSGYLGGRLDRALNVAMDSLYAFPGLLLAMAIAAVLGPSPINAAVAIAVVYIPTYFRMARGEAMVVKSSLFVEAAVAAGASRSWVVFRHILPNLVPTLAVVATVNVADAALTESALAFLGYTVVPPTPDWGADLSAARADIALGRWWLLAPGLFVILAALGFSMLGEGLGDRVGRGRWERR